MTRTIPEGQGDSGQWQNIKLKIMNDAVGLSLHAAQIEEPIHFMLEIGRKR